MTPQIFSHIARVALILICAAVLLFARLGHYALWDDEANTALFAEGICQTGDTSAMIGHNLVAYEGGWELKNLRERFIPPLPAYMAAASIALLGKTAFAARLPFTLCGLGLFVLITIWLKRDHADAWTWGLLAFALLANISLILYFRQARYYGVVIFLTALIAYGYLHWTRSLRGQFLLTIAGFLLFAANFISFAAIAFCVLVDWCIWGKRMIRLDVKRAAMLGIPLAIAVGALVLIYNPLNVSSRPPEFDKPGPQLLQIYADLRDLNVNEFCVIPLLLLAPIIGFVKKDPWLLRGSLAFVVYLAVVHFIEPHHSSFAHLRFLVPLIPLFCLLEVRTLLIAAGRRKWIALLIGIPLFGTNFFSGSTFFHPSFVMIPLRSTPMVYAGELLQPPPDPYTAASNWINENLPPDSTILVLPKYQIYPLMFHAPGAIYAWQLTDPAAAQFAHLPDIHFANREAPQYMILFGLEGLAYYEPFKLRDGTPLQYELIKTLMVNGKDFYRPELYVRIFTAAPVNPRNSAIYIYKRKTTAKTSTTHPN